MRVSSRFDGSICGAIPLFLHRPSLSSSASRSAAAAITQGSAHSPGGGPAQRWHGGCAACSRRYKSVSSTLPFLPRRPSLALPAHRVSSRIAPTGNVGGVPRPSTSASRSDNHTAAAAEESADQELDDNGGPPRARSPPHKPGHLRSFTKKELLDLVEDYDHEGTGSIEDYLEYLRDPYMLGYAQPNAHHITFARNAEDVEYPSLEQVIRAGEQEQKTLWELRFAVIARLRSPHKVDLDHIYDLYQRLPEPRMLYIHARFRHQLLRVFGQPDQRNSGSMLRYFELIADVKNTGIALTTAEWNCAITMASKYVGIVTETEVEAALKMWREMEVQAGVKANNVTFNILFDVACKAGNLALAEMIYREMESRGHRYNRYHHTSLIHFFGLKLETGGMRAAYMDMVNAGEIVDTVVLNAMISGLLRSGEEAAAERIYERMKAASLSNADRTTTPADKPHTAPSFTPLRTPMTDRAITQTLLMFAKISRRLPAARPALQRLAPLAPDLQTYRILVNHYGVKRGDLARAAAYIDEMRHFQIPLHHAIFLALFKGFATHGGFARSAWSERRLTGIWNALLDALDAGVEGLEVKTWLAVWALRAFAVCSSRERVLDVYDALKARWSLGSADEQFMVDFLSGLVSNKRPR